LWGKGDCPYTVETIHSVSPHLPKLLWAGDGRWWWAAGSRDAAEKAAGWLVGSRLLHSDLVPPHRNLQFETIIVEEALAGVELKF
jgi:hypothetical protein